MIEKRHPQDGAFWHHRKLHDKFFYRADNAIAHFFNL